MKEKIEEIKYYDKKGEEYWRDMYDLFGNWIGIETKKFITSKEAEKQGYKITHLKRRY